MQRPCNAKIVATLGPASADRATIEAMWHDASAYEAYAAHHGTPPEG